MQTWGPEYFSEDSRTGPRPGYFYHAHGHQEQRLPLEYAASMGTTSGFKESFAPSLYHEYSPREIQLEQWHLPMCEEAHDWSKSWYHFDPQDLVLTDVPKPLVNQCCPMLQRNAKQLPLPSPFSHGSNQSDDLFETALHQRLMRTPHQELEMYGTHLSSAMLSTASSHRLAGYHSSPSPGMALNLPPTMARMAQHLDLQPLDQPYLPSQMTQSTPSSIRWSEQEAPSSGSQGTFGQPDFTADGIYRSHSTPKPLESSPSEDSQQPSKKRRRAKKEPGFSSVASAPQPNLVPVVKSACNSIRIVSGKGEFDFPRSHRKAENKMFVTIRSNELGRGIVRCNAEE